MESKTTWKKRMIVLKTIFRNVERYLELKIVFRYSRAASLRESIHVMTSVKFYCR